MARRLMLVVRNNTVSAGSPFSGTFRAGDGQWLYIIAAGHSRNSRSLVKALEVYDDLIAEGMVDVPVYENLHLTNKYSRFIPFVQRMESHSTREN